ncbi:MAG: putative polymerase sigma factor [Modestobacter sp.]|jgi:hypothetical protein|nr:putative polymerase sigma factor [Modestobacter sp.]
MSTPSNDQPTRELPAVAAPPVRELPATADQPAPTTDAPPPVSFWRQKVPAHIGRARTSTIVLGVLFVALFALYLGIRPPAVQYTTVESTSGETYRVPVTARVTPEPSETSAPTSEVPEPTAPAGTTPAPTVPPSSSPADTGSSDEQQEPQTTAPARTSTPEPTPTGSPDTQRAPVTSEAPEQTSQPETTSSPTG